MADCLLVRCGNNGCKIINSAGIKLTSGGRVVFFFSSRRRHTRFDCDWSSDVCSSDLGQRLPPTWRVLRRLPAESLSAAAKGTEADRCTPHLPRRADTLVRTMRNVPVALRLRFPSGGEAILLADGQYLSNRILKDTDAGVAVLPWFLDARTRQIVVDEFHLGFGAGGTLPGASWAWLRHHPPGWAILQLIGVALVALAVTAVRFGPTRSVIERRRRSRSEEHTSELQAQSNLVCRLLLEKTKTRTCISSFFFFNDTATTEIYTLSLHDALPISARVERCPGPRGPGCAITLRGGRSCNSSGWPSSRWR